ncbi:hypothetical protein COT99_00340 [Candidatus Falkowbacteria bacterium CG10_big_fil_rev_8_21_14_0_10_43_10]|uniref:Segregation and condensation protein A n=1 Tax=Candidatus Falkowbacteria bacterium CG10_big_fil_rev_8_21_14_0_10_43_10 TaxID=1974567 RepID=A0A2H0V323_9BACT|nr:MAG: hypothetical protein COT99_00340 [Candidatus Falkowbacteria bacterium CG10_big_fil_rev_8_21_14_0_10_43_10]
MDIKLQQFNGPLDLLVQMIDEEKLDITEVSLANIADQFIDYIKNKADIDPEEMADFLVVAARLLLIKSKTLLPYLIRGEEEEEIHNFEKQLKIYKDFLEASQKIESMLAERNFMFGREFNKNLLTDEAVFYPPQNVNQKVLRQVFEEMAARLKQAEQLEEDSIIKAISIEEKMSKIQLLLRKLNSFDFKGLLDRQATKIDVIVSFLAMLELIKQRAVIVEQKELFMDITILKI